MQMKLLTETHLTQLQANYRENLLFVEEGKETIDFKPVVKLFCPWGQWRFLLTELDPDNIAYGLADLGFGEPELGYTSIDEIAAVNGPFGLKIERDIHFKADKTLSQYAEIARKNRRIIA